MAFNHRKLISDFANVNIYDICQILCDPTTTTEGLCPTSCISRCPSICYLPLISLITPPDPPTTTTTTTSDYHPAKTQKLHLFLVISLSLLAATCFAFSCYTLCRYYKNNWDRSRSRSSSLPQQEEEDTHDEFLDEDHGAALDHHYTWFIRTVGLQPWIINSIAVCKYKRGDGLVEGTECSVCLNEFREDETLRLLPKCSHAFHIPCIDTWLRSHTSCPMCRAGIIANAATPGFQTAEQNFGNSAVREEARVVVSERSGDFRDGECEEAEREVENGVNDPETSKEEVFENGHLGVDEVQPMRRSVSMDSVSASRISFAVDNAHPGESAGNSGPKLAKQLNKSNMDIIQKKLDVNQSLLRFLGGSSVGRSSQKGPISMKRSLSCSGKVFLSRYSQNRSSTLPS